MTIAQYKVWRAWCHKCKLYLAADLPASIRPSYLVCGACRGHRPCCRGGSYVLVGDIQAAGHVTGTQDEG